MRRILTLLAASAHVAACQPANDSPAGDSRSATSATLATPQVRESEATVYDGIAESETVHFTGTEPFWGGEIANGTARYSTPENIDGTSFPVTRFAGNNGIGFSGTMDGQRFDLTVTPGDCSDGMSDRTYPFTATLTIGAEQRNGCAWTNRQGFTGPRNP